MLKTLPILATVAFTASAVAQNTVHRNDQQVPYVQGVTPKQINPITNNAAWLMIGRAKTWLECLAETQPKYLHDLALLCRKENQGELWTGDLGDDVPAGTVGDTLDITTRDT